MVNAFSTFSTCEEFTVVRLFVDRKSQNYMYEKGEHSSIWQK